MKQLIVALILALSLGSACFQGDPGTNGKDGNQGLTGPTGSPGVGCTYQLVAPGDVVLAYGGAIITCANGSVLISNGAPGADGQPAPSTPYAIAEIIHPCGNTSAWHEVFLRFADGEVVASFSDDTGGSWTRLSVLVDGYNLMTTDHTGCTFDLSTTGNTRTITWHSGGSESWTVDAD